MFSGVIREEGGKAPGDLIVVRKETETPASLFWEGQERIYLLDVVIPRKRLRKKGRGRHSSPAGDL